MAVTIRDVAALAGVSPATVSRTCNNNPVISTETREKVWQAIATLGYKVPRTGGRSSGDSGGIETGSGEADIIAGGLENSSATNSATNSAISSATSNIATGQTNGAPLSFLNTIGIIMRPQGQKGYDNPFVTRCIRGICQTALERGYATTIVSGENYDEILAHVRRLAVSHQVQGFVFMYSVVEDPLITYMHESGIPFVVIGKAGAYVNDTVYVDNDNLVAGQDAANYLIGMGHKKIAFVCDNIAQIFAYERNAGIQLSMLQNGLPIPEEALISGAAIPLSHDGSMAQLLLSENSPTALIVIDDTVAVAIVQLCHELGISVPEELSILTFNNSIMTKLSTPPLTTIDVNSRQLGMKAAAQLITMLQNPGMTATKIIVPHYLVRRDSCQPPKE